MAKASRPKPARPGGPAERHEPATHAMHLRDRIDRGRTGDKVNHPDPSAAPLGTDDESSGHTPGPEQVGQALASETRTPRRSAETDPAAPHATRQGVGPGGILLFLFAMVVLGAVFLALAA